jgi:hypothetical protein
MLGCEEELGDRRVEDVVVEGGYFIRCAGLVGMAIGRHLWIQVVVRLFIWLHRWTA